MSRPAASRFLCLPIAVLSALVIPTSLGLLGVMAAPRSVAAVESPPATTDQNADQAIEAAYQFALGKMLAEEGSYDQALEAYERSIELDGSALHARLELAQFHLLLAQMSRSLPARSAHLESAAEQVEAARQLAPENSDTLRAYGQVELQLAEREPPAAGRAAAAFEKLRERGEADLQVLTSLGQIYLWQHQAKQAVDVLQEATNLLPGHRTLNKMLLQALMQADEVERAEGVLRQLVAAEPDSLESLLQLTDVLSRQGKHEAAVEVLREAPAALREEPQLRQALAGELHLAGEERAALVEVDALLAENPEQGGLRRLRVQVLSGLLRYDDAIAELRKIAGASGGAGASTLDVDLVLSRLLERVGRSDEAIAQLRKAVARSGEQDGLRVRLALVGALERDGQLDAAAALVEEALPQAELANLPLLARSSSDLLERAGRTEAAIGTLEAAAARLEGAGEPEAADRLRLARWALLAGQERWRDLADGTEPLLGAANPELQLGARLLHAEALSELGELDDALAGLREEGLDPRLARQLEAKRAELLLRFGRAEEGRAAVEALVGGGSADTLATGAQIYQRAGFFEDMFGLATRTLELEPESVRALYLVGSAAERTGRFERAAEAFKRLLDLEPEYAPALNYLGYLWAERGENLETARQLIEKAVALEPDNGAYVDSLGWVYFQLGRYPEARRHLQWAAKLLPEDATIWEHLGDLSAKMGEIEPARAAYRKAIEVGADDPDKLQAKLQELAPTAP